MSTVLSTFVSALSATKLLGFDTTPYMAMSDSQLKEWANANVDHTDQNVLNFVGIVSCFPKEDASPEEVLSFLCGSMCELSFEGHSALIVFDVCAKLAYVQYLLECERISCKEGFILLCKGSHILRPSKDTLWPAVRQCLSAVSCVNGSEVKPWLPSKPK